MNKYSSIVNGEIRINKHSSTVVERFSPSILQNYHLPIIVVYFKPKDFPNNFVARLFNFDKATEFCIVKDTFEEIRQAIPVYMTNVGRNECDDPKIVEVWI